MNLSWEKPTIKLLTTDSVQTGTTYFPGTECYINYDCYATFGSAGTTCSYSLTNMTLACYASWNQITQTASGFGCNTIIGTTLAGPCS